MVGNHNRGSSAPVLRGSTQRASRIVVPKGEMISSVAASSCGPAKGVLPRFIDLPGRSPCSMARQAVLSGERARSDADEVSLSLASTCGNPPKFLVECTIYTICVARGHGLPPRSGDERNYFDEGAYHYVLFHGQIPAQRRVSEHLLLYRVIDFHTFASRHPRRVYFDPFFDSLRLIFPTEPLSFHKP